MSTQSSSREGNRLADTCETCYTQRVKTITVREVRLHWPRAEQALQREGELVVTRDGKPVARLLPFEPTVQSGARFDPATHLEWLRKVWKDETPAPSTDEWLREDRDE